MPKKSRPETEPELDVARESVLRMQRRFRIAIAGYLCVLVLALTPWTQDPAGDIKRLILLGGSAILAASWLAASWRRGVPVRRPRMANEVLLVFLAFFLAGTLLSPFRGVSVTQLCYFFALYALYFVASQVYNDARQVDGLLVAFVVALVLASLYAFAQKLGLDPFPWTDRDQDVYTNLPGTFGNPNYAAHTLILGIIAAIYLAWSQHNRWFLGAAGVFLVYQYFTEQRAGLIALAAVLVFLGCVWAAGKLWRPPVGRAAAALAITVALGLAGVGGYMLQNKMRNGSALPLDGSLLLRYNGYLNAAAMIMDRPLLGHGPGVYALRTPAYWTSFEQQWFAQEQRLNAHVHNDLLEVAVDAGLPAAGLYLSAMILGISFGLLFALSSRTGGRGRIGFMFAGVFLAFLVDGLFGFNLRVPVSASLFFVLLGCLEGLWSNAPAGAVRTARPGTWGRVWRTGMAGAAIFTAAWGLTVFVSELFLQAGLRAHFESLRILNASPGEQRGMDPEQARAFVMARAADARAALEWGERLAPWNHRFAGRMGEAGMALREYPRAVADLERALALNPYYIPTLARLANAKLALAEEGMDEAEAHKTAPDPKAARLLNEAEAYADQIMGLCPPFPTAEDLEGRICCARAKFLSESQPPAERAEIMAQWDAAEDHVTRAIALGARNHIDLYRLLARIREERGDRDGREEAIVRAVQADPADEIMWKTFFDYAMHAKVSDRVLSTLYLLIAHIGTLDPPRNDALAQGYMVLGYCQAQKKDLPSADAAYENAIRVGQDRADIWTAFAQYTRRNDKLPMFEAALDKTTAEAEADGVVSQNGLSVAQLLMAEIREASGQTPELIDAAYRKAVRFGPDRPDTWANYANFARKNDRMEEFKAVLKESCAKCLVDGPTPLAYVRAVCDVLERGASALEAASETLLRQFREYPENDARLRTVHLGWATQLLLEALAAAQESGAPLCMTYLNLGIILAGMDQFTAAEALFPPAMQCLDGVNAAVAGTHWADIMQRSGRLEEARNLLKDLAARFPDTLMVRWAYAQLLAKVNQVPEALQEYDAILAFPFLQPSERVRLESERTALMQAPVAPRP